MITETFKGYPYPPKNDKVKLYMLVTQGYHLGSLVQHFFSTRRNDFIEMALHHIVTIYLYCGCYMMNCTEIGAVIAFLHDIADITTPFCKGLGETKFKNATIIVFITNMLLWAYTRNVVFPYIIYNIIFNIGCDFNGEPLVRPYFSYLLTCLAVLHYYWMYMIFKLLHNYIKTDQTEDLQNKL